jgi:hypothetical protein
MVDSVKRKVPRDMVARQNTTKFLNPYNRPFKHSLLSSSCPLNHWINKLIDTGSFIFRQKKTGRV